MNVSAGEGIFGGLGQHMSIKNTIRRFTRALGFDIHRYQPVTPDELRLIKMLAAHGVNLVFDIGANTGQFGGQIRKAGYKGRIVSFEALTSAHQQLLAARNNDPLWEVAPQAAVGEEDGEIEIHLAGNSVSSSVLNMLDTHKSAAPDSAYVSSEKVPLRRLDTLAMNYIHPGDALFLKIDTQGYEDRVLGGAPVIMAKAIGVQLELSLVPLYNEQKLYEEMKARLETMGFELWSVTPEFVDPASGRLLQLNATFFRPAKARQARFE
ncbi:MAG TPA: FkbM family methyltransferase [Gallionellaceae bacterium]